MKSVNSTALIPGKQLATGPAAQFGEYRLDRSGVLRHSGRIVDLPPKELALLRLLVEKRGDVVTRGEIEKRIWPRQTVSYSSVASCVYSLRKRIESNATSLIQTVPRRGYRLTLPVVFLHEKQSKSALEDSVRTQPLAHAHFLAGLQQASIAGPENLAQAVSFFQAAVRADPGYATAYAAIADTRMYQALRGHIAPRSAYRQGVEACDTALTINPDHVPALATKGWFIGVVDGAISNASALIDRALALDPEYARAHSYYSWLMRTVGNSERAVSAMCRAVEFDPYTLLVRHGLAWTYFCDGQVEMAIEVAQKIIAEFPQDSAAHSFLGVFSAFLGLNEQALEAGSTAMALEPDTPLTWAVLAYIEARSGKRLRARDLLNRALNARGLICPKAWLAPVLVEMGDKTRARKLLSRGLDDRCAWAAAAIIDPRLESLELARPALARRA